MNPQAPTRTAAAIAEPAVYGDTDPGQKRPDNQDHVYWAPTADAAHGRLLIVADGIGGYQGGARASEIAVERVAQTYAADPSPDALAALRGAVEAANAAIYGEAQQQADHAEMGSTIVAAVLLGNRLLVANVGDSRAYVVHGGRSRQITHDHSWVAEQLRAGVLTAVEARAHPLRNQITRSLGRQPAVEVDTFTVDLTPGDVVLLCSDGLHGQVRDAELAREAAARPPHEAVTRLIQLANQRGGPDNISAVVARMPGGAGMAARLPVPLWMGAGLAAALVVVLIALLSVDGPWRGDTGTPTVPAVALIPTATPTAVTGPIRVPETPPPTPTPTRAATATPTKAVPTVAPPVPTATAITSATAVPSTTQTPPSAGPCERTPLGSLIMVDERSKKPMSQPGLMIGPRNEGSALTKLAYKSELYYYGVEENGVPYFGNPRWYIVGYRNFCGYLWAGYTIVVRGG
ncbi:MAG: Stp1/IreP family PP2C-type Ser/Thr phosphatase [Chloroflexi bacterium]|nr:Stp1/IreP family PP2C-type Ser/Thr phosphatase [Chloroflexota bacterium]